MEGKDSKSCYASLLDKTARLFASPVRKGGSKKRQACGRPVGKRVSHKADMYRKHQQKYSKDRALTALILEKETGSKSELGLNLVEATYMERFGGV